SGSPPRNLAWVRCGRYLANESSSSSEYTARIGGRCSRRARIVDEYSPLHWTHSRLQVLEIENSICFGHSGTSEPTANRSNRRIRVPANTPSAVWNEQNSQPLGNVYPTSAARSAVIRTPRQISSIVWIRTLPITADEQQLRTSPA